MALLTRPEGAAGSLADFLSVFSDFHDLQTTVPLKHRCPTTGITRDGRFEKESCFGLPTWTFWGNPGKPKRI